MRCTSKSRILNLSDAQIRILVNQAFDFVKSKCLAEDGCCIESSVNMHNYLTKRGVEAYLRRYETPRGGHWTIDTTVGEFDPTISCWGDKAPKDSVPGEMYEVTPKSPHKMEWEEDKDVSEYDAYQSVWIEEE